MPAHKYDKILDQFKIYYPDCFDAMVDWWPSGRNSIGVKINNGERLDYNSIENSIRWIKTDCDYDTDGEIKRVEVGRNLEKLVSYCGISKREIAERLGITSAMLSRYIHGKTMPAFDKAYQLAKILGCNMEELFDETYIE